MKLASWMKRIITLPYPNKETSMCITKLYPGQFFQIKDYPDLPRSYYENSIGYVSYIRELVHKDLPEKGNTKFGVKTYIVRQGKAGKPRLVRQTIATLFINKLEIHPDDKDILSPYLGKKTNFITFTPENLLTVPDLHFVAWIRAKSDFFSQLLRYNDALSKEIHKFLKKSSLGDINQLGSALMEDLRSCSDFMDTKMLSGQQRINCIQDINRFSAQNSWYINQYYRNMSANTTLAKIAFRKTLKELKATKTLKTLIP